MLTIKRKVVIFITAIITLSGFCLVNAGDSSLVVAEIKEDKIVLSDITKGSEKEFYEAEKKLYELKMGNLRKILITKLVALDPRSKGMEDIDYITSYVAPIPDISEKQIQEFIKSRKIPEKNVNKNLKKRVSDYLIDLAVAEKVDVWFDNQIVKHKIKINLKEPEEPFYKVSIGSAPYFGGKNAKVTIIEYSDFECPYCSKAAEVVQQLRKKYGKKIKFAYKQFPLGFHPNAQKAAEASLCANEQDVKYFWKMHDFLFVSTKNLKQGVIKDYAKKMGLNMKKFSACLKSNQMADRVKQEMQEAMELGVSSTPAFFVNGRLILGAQPLEAFVDKIDAELAL